MRNWMRCLEKTVTPAVLTRENGQVLYRNPTAKLRGIGRRTGAMLTNYLPSADADCFGQAVAQGRAAVLTMPCDGVSRKLLLLPLQGKSEAAVLLLALAVLQTPREQSRILDTKPCDLLGSLHPERMQITEQDCFLPADARLLQLYEKLLALRLGDGAGSPIRLHTAAPLLQRYFDDCTGRLGIEMQTRFEDRDPASLVLRFGDGLLTAVLGITTVLLGATSSKSGRLHLYVQQGRLHIGLELPNPTLPLRRIPEGEEPLLFRMAAAYPAWAAELVSLGEICRRYGWASVLYRNENGSLYFDLEGEEVERCEYLCAEDSGSIKIAYLRLLAFLAA